jgi:hypothetical protein
VTNQHFAQTLLCAPFVFAAVLWAFAFSLCGRTGRLLLTAGIYLIFEPRRGRHEARSVRDQPPTYDGDPVSIRDNRTEAQRATAYALMRAQTELLPVTVSAAPLMDWTSELYPTDFEELRATLEDIERRFRATVDTAVADFMRGQTTEQLLVPA